MRANKESFITLIRVGNCCVLAAVSTPHSIKLKILYFLFAIKMKNSHCLRASIAIMTCTGVWLPDRFAEYPRKLYYIIFAVCMQSLIFISVVLAEISYLFSVSFGDARTFARSLMLLYCRNILGT